MREGAKLNDVLFYIKSINDIVNSVVWGPPMLLFFLLVGIYFSIRLKFFQLFNFNLWIKNTLGSLLKPRNKNAAGSISPFQALTTALAGSIGTGNIVGVATAITLGGPGAIFWMWIASFFSMMTIFAENILGIRYRKKNRNGEWVGGPMYYIEQGLHQKWLAVFFAVACILSTFGMGNMTQANSIAQASKEIFNTEPRITALITAAIVGCVIFGGVKRIASVSEYVVPFMAIFYSVGGIIVIIFNIKFLPEVMKSIMSQAINLSSVIGGTSGYIMMRAVKYGVSRGVFSNEAGLGSSPIIYSAAETDEATVQGMWGIFQVFFDTIVGCSITALCILCSGANDGTKDGVELSIAAFYSVFGRYGSIFVGISIIMFALATLIGWSYYGEKSLEYLTGGAGMPIFKAVYIVVILFGSVIDLRLVWDISDTFNGLMAIPNLAAILYLSNEVVCETKSYLKRQKSSK